MTKIDDTPIAERALSPVMARIAAAIGPATLLQAACAVGFLWLFTSFVAARTATYYRDMPAPPSFRHMDAMDLKRVLVDYLDAQHAGPDTVLVLGDCVAFGHGVIHPFPSMLKFPGYHVVNISMQSFRYDLMLLIIDEAMRRGVTHVLVQLHPFEDYVAEAAFWKRLKAQRLHQSIDTVPGVDALSARELIDDAEANWRVMALAQKEGTERFYDYDQHVPTATLTEWLRYDVLSAWPLYRDRFAIDDWSSLGLSYYTSRTHRTDSYVATLPEQQQRDIFKSQLDFFAKFVIADRPAYTADMERYSAAARIAAVLKAGNADAVFIMAPTFIDRIEANTSLRRADLAFASETMRRIVSARGFPYLNYLQDAELDAQMVHFDNLTAEGQRLLAGKLNADLSGASFPRPARASR